MLNDLHEDISNLERLRILSGYELSRVVSAPGHVRLRNPDAVRTLAELILKSPGESPGDDPILLSAFTRVRQDTVVLRSVECLDGNHRLAAGLLSGAWRALGDIRGSVDVLINGWRAGGHGPEPRWIPLEVAERSAIPRDRWFPVPAEWGPKGPSAQVPGDISSLDPVFFPGDRGVSIRTVLERSLRDPRTE